jgi:sulfate adenylyltransferase
MKYEIGEELLQDLINIENELFFPLKGFMDSKDYTNVINKMTLSDGRTWTIPITFDIPADIIKNILNADELILTYQSKDVGILKVEDVYKVDSQDILKVYGTEDTKHPGVYKEKQRSVYRIGGETKVIDKSILKGSLNPSVTKEHFQNKNWNTIVGFQTRNVVHRAHEYLQRVGLELCDALFINPLVGWKKVGDFSEEAVNNGYSVMIEKYYKGLNVYFNTLKTPMRYAGPREAIFHAIIRRNLGCTHFIIGRDHAGVGDYYGKYAAHELAKEVLKKGNLGIELLLLKEPYYCNICEQIVSENCCAHDDIIKISGTKIREMLSSGKVPSSIMMRKEVAQEIVMLKEGMFING